MNKKEKLLQYFCDHDEEFIEVIESLDNYSGILGDRRCYPMDELDELFYGTKPIDLANRMFYGYDDEYESRSQFCPNREFFYINGYGNLVSTDEQDYSDFLDEYFCEQVVKYAADIELPEGVQDILDSEVTEDE